MNSDGTNNRQLGFGPFGNPSTALHGGRRWFLYERSIPDVYYLDGTQRLNCSHSATTTTNLNNNPVTRVQLTYDIDLQAQALARTGFSAIRRSGSSPALVRRRGRRGGCYTASPVFDADGDVAGLAAQPTTPAISFPLVEAAPGDLLADFEGIAGLPPETR